jgi:hypothetical protein
MSSHSLFGHLVTRFSTYPENLATEALNYILNISTVARTAFLRYMSQLGLVLPSDLLFQSQPFDAETGIPDIVGINPEGKQIVIVEAKFWAGLTDNQPVAYLKRLPLQTESVFLVIAPAKRIPILWGELISRCKIAGLAIGNGQSLGQEVFFRKIDDYQVIAITSWRSILGYLISSLETTGETIIASDIRQLQGLCEKMDEDAFLPIRSEELTSNLGSRIVQYCGLVDEVTNLAVAEGLASVSGLRATGGFGWYGRYLRIQKCGCCFYFSAMDWAHVWATPLWLSVKDPKWQPTSKVKDALLPLQMEDPPRLLNGSWPLIIPLSLRLGVEKNEVVQSLLLQLRGVSELLKKSFGHQHQEEGVQV